MTSDFVDIATKDGDMPAYLSSPDGAARGAVVVMHEVFGITAHMEEICRRLSSIGWCAVAPAFFHRAGSPVIDYEDPAPGVALMNALTEAGIAIDLDATIAFLADRSFTAKKIGSVGFCMGGSLALYFATAHDIGAASTFYGVGILSGQSGLSPLVELAPKLRCPWLGLYGADDTRASTEAVEALRSAASQSPGPTEVVVYENAGHAFHCDARPDRFNPIAAADAWKRTLELFDDYLK